MTERQSLQPAIPVRLCLLALIFTPLIIRLVTYSVSGRPNVSPPLHYANWVIILHIMLGAFVMMKHLVIHMTLPHALINVIISTILYGVVWMEMETAVWSALYALLFSCAIIKYCMVRNDHLPGTREKTYVGVKIKNEWPVIPLFAALSLFAWLLPANSTAQQSIEVAPLILGIAFFIWLAFFKRAYNWVLKDLIR